MNAKGGGHGSVSSVCKCAFGSLQSQPASLHEAGGGYTLVEVFTGHITLLEKGAVASDAAGRFSSKAVASAMPES